MSYMVSQRLRRELAKNNSPFGAELVAHVSGSNVGALLSSLKNSQVISAMDAQFGAVGDGIADDTTAIQSFYDYLKTNGGIGMLNPGKIFGVSARIYTSGGTKPFAVFGYKSEIKRISDFGASVLEINSTDGICHYGLKIDCQHQIFPNGNHGMVYSNCNDSLAVDVEVINHKNTGVMMYATVPGVYKNNIMRNCKAVGNSSSNAANGLLIANLDYSDIENGYAENITLSPGYGLQLKNLCRWCKVTGRVKNCTAAAALGNDSGTTGVQDSYVNVEYSEECEAAFTASWAYRNTVKIGVVKGSTVASRNFIDLALNCEGNSINVGNIYDAAANQILARLRSGCSNNVVKCDVVKRAVGTAVGAVATFDAGVTGNVVEVGLLFGATTAYTSNMVTNNSGNSSNFFQIGNAPASQQATIAGDAITISHGKINSVIVDTEGAAASDNLATINGGAEGQILKLSSASNIRDVTVKHGTGNIVLNGASDFILDTASDGLLLCWSSNLSKWQEVGRGNNA